LIADFYNKCFSAQFFKSLKITSPKYSLFFGVFRKLLNSLRIIVSAIKQGVAIELIKDDLESISQPLSKIEAALQTKETLKPLLHPSRAGRYREAIDNLTTSLNHQEY